MIRKYNYTGRIKILKEQVTIHQLNNQLGKFFTASFAFSDLSFPANARIYVEAYFKSSFLRFSFGTVAEILAPKDTLLNDLPITERVLYRVKVVDESSRNGLILGFVDEISPIVNDSLGGKNTLLPVDFNDLGNRVWFLDFRPEGPVLSVNYEGNIPKIREMVKDKMFVSFVYPEVVRQIACHILFNEDSGWDDQDSWIANWIKFFRKSLQIAFGERPTNPSDIEQLVDSIVEAFCQRNSIIKLLE